MKWLKLLWVWLLSEKNQKALAILFTVIAGGWAAYERFTEKPKDPMTTFKASENGSINIERNKSSQNNSATINKLYGLVTGQEGDIIYNQIST